MLICRACLGIPGPIRASGGNGTGCIPPSAETWKLYALLEEGEDRRKPEEQEWEEEVERSRRSGDWGEEEEEEEEEE